MNKTAIEWTDYSWNPVTGCDKVSPGCKNCYAEQLALRFQKGNIDKYAQGFSVTTHVAALREPYLRMTPQRIFVASMGDVLHSKVGDYFLQRIFMVMNDCYWHTFQVLTKRPERFAELSRLVKWSPNIWMGVSVENEDVLSRIELLRKCKAHLKFLSLEPLLGPLPRLDLRGIGWVIVGGETGPGARPMEKVWLMPILKQCVDSNIPFFFKSWGGSNKPQLSHTINGMEWHQFPIANKEGN